MIVRFEDRRGNEGDQGDPRGIGGIYGGYGNRNAKVMSREPWPPIFHDALVSEFRAAGVHATLVDGRPAPPTAAMLEGEIRNFSTESRWSKRAHISAIVRLIAVDGRTLFEKEIKATESGGMGGWDEEVLEALMNKVFADFVRRVATDPDIHGSLR